MSRSFNIHELSEHQMGMHTLMKCILDHPMNIENIYPKFQQCTFKQCQMMYIKIVIFTTIFELDFNMHY